jgi:O-antigen/teichoic acid export membrane protein/aminoglycoside phosphotransferase
LSTAGDGLVDGGGRRPPGPTGRRHPTFRRHADRLGSYLAGRWVCAVNVAIETHGDSAVSVGGARRWDPLTRNGYLLIASSLVTSALGVVFWTLAAHRFDRDAVGRSAAAIGLLTVLGNVSQLNLVNALNRFLPVAGRQSRRLIVAAYATVAVAGFVVAAIFLLGQPWWAPDLGALRDGPAAFVVFPIVVVAWTLFIVEDGALAGLRASAYVLGSNAAYAAAKILVLLVLPVSASELGIFWAWSLTVIPVVMGVTWILWRRMRPDARSGYADEVPSILEPVSLRPVARFAAADYTATMVLTATQGLLPVFLLALVGPGATAHFALAWIVAYVPYLAGRGMGMSLLTEAARAPRELGALTWRTLQRAAAVVVPMVVVLVAGAPWLLRVFGAEYAEHAATLLRLLALAALPALVTATYIAILRARNRYRAQITLAVAMSAVVLGSLAPATSRFGVVAVGWIWLITQLAAALLLSLTELRRLCGPVVGRSDQGLVGFCRRLLRPRAKGTGRVLARVVRDHYGTAHATPTWQRTFGHVDVAIVEVAGRDGVVLKIGRTPSGSRSVLAGARRLDQLSAHVDVQARAKVGIPNVLATGRVDGRTYALETRLPGHSARLLVSHGMPVPTAVGAAADALEAVHRATRSAMTDAAQGSWTDGPAQELRMALADRRRDGLDVALERLLADVDRDLTSTEPIVAFTHGDAWLGNVVLDPALGAVGLVDWASATPCGLPAIDAMTLIVTARLDRCEVELGELVRDLLAITPANRWEDWEAAILIRLGVAIDGGPASRGAVHESAALRLAWLHHVANVMSKAARHRPGTVWFARNVEALLEAQPARTE